MHAMPDDASAPTSLQQQLVRLVNNVTQSERNRFQFGHLLKHSVNSQMSLLVTDSLGVKGLLCQKNKSPQRQSVLLLQITSATLSRSSFCRPRRQRCKSARQPPSSVPLATTNHTTELPLAAVAALLYQNIFHK